MTAKFEDARNYAAPKERIFHACIDAMQLSGFKIIGSDPQSGSISAVSSDSQYSSRRDSGFFEEVGLIMAELTGFLSKFRERISVRIDDEGSVHACSVSEPRTVILDQGRNRQHVLKLWGALDAALRLPRGAPVNITNDNSVTITGNSGSVQNASPYAQQYRAPSGEGYQVHPSSEDLRAASMQPDGVAIVPPAADACRKVFIVHGRDGTLAARFRDLLRTVGLEPLEWEKLVQATESTAPFLGQVVTTAPHQAQATLVLLSPDDVVELHPDLLLDNDHPSERARSMQARPNVIFELGLALKAFPERTIVVEVGEMRLVSDLAGLNVIRFTGSLTGIKKVLDRLGQAGCPVDLSGTDWMDEGRFADLAAHKRGPR